MKFCREIRPFLLRKTTNMRKPVTVVAVTLYYLADERRFRKITNAFGLAKCTVSVIVRKVCLVISTVMAPRYITFPKTKEDVKKAVECFYEKHGFPPCFGAIDGTHAFVKPPRENPMDYINR